MPPPAKTLSPAELTKLEHAFASDPGSDAYAPLAEAYLAMSRFMEAMVVCKKGVKAHPDRPEPHLLLARVYSDQGKDKKALEELAEVVRLDPKNKVGLRLTGVLQLKAGDAAAGQDCLLRAWDVDPDDPETKSMLADWKIPEPARAPPPAPEPVRAQAPEPVPTDPAPAASAASASPGPGASAKDPAPPMLTPAASAQPSRHPTAPARAPAARAQVQPVSRPPRARSHFEDDEDDYPASSRKRASQSGGFGQKAFIGLLIALPLAVGTYYFLGQKHAADEAAFSQVIKQAADDLKHDSYASYEKACKDAEKALTYEPDSTIAHAYLAYAYAIRWGEHGGGDEARNFAEQNLAAAQKSGQVDSHIYAAAALMALYSGHGKQALDTLAGQIHQLDAEGKKSSLMYLTLGLIQTRSGDLEGALQSLQAAQGLAPADPRIYAALGTLYRRRGQDVLAWQAYDYALRYEAHHPESMLGKTLLMLDQENPDPALTAKQMENAAKILQKLLEDSPPPSPRQLATAHLARSFLIDRVSRLLPQLRSSAAKKLAAAADVSGSASALQAEIQKEEDAGFHLDRNDPELHLIKGRRLLLDGKVDAAVKELRAAIALDPQRAQLHVALAQALMRKPAGTQEAVAALQSALKAMGDSPKLLTMLGQAYRAEGKLDQALAALARAVDDPKAKNPEARLLMAKVELQQHHFDKAKSSLEKALSGFVEQPKKAAEAYAVLARVFDGQGDRKQADENFKKALDTDRDFTDGYFFYARFMSEDPRSADKAHILAQEYLRRAPSGTHAADAAKL